MAKLHLSGNKLSSDELNRMLCTDTTEAVSMDTATNSASVSKDTIAPKFPVSMDTQVAENAVSKDTITGSNSVSKDTIPGNDAVSMDTDRVAYQRDFRKKRYKTVSLDMRPEEVKRFKEYAANNGLSMTEFFRRAANAYIVSMDTGK